MFYFVSQVRHVSLAGRQALPRFPVTAVPRPCRGQRASGRVCRSHHVHFFQGVSLRLEAIADFRIVSHTPEYIIAFLRWRVLRIFLCVFGVRCVHVDMSLCVFLSAACSPQDSLSLRASSSFGRLHEFPVIPLDEELIMCLSLRGGLSQRFAAREA